MPGAPTLPSTQAVLLREDSSRAIAEVLSEDGLEPQTAARSSPRHAGDPFALLIYLADNHGELRRVGGCDSWELYSTKHGVALYDSANDRSAWVFIETDVQKLRWPSITSARCSAGLVLVEYRVDPLGGFGLAIVAPRPGSFGTIELTRAGGWRVEEKRQQLVVNNRRYPLARLRQQLTSAADR